MITAYACSSPSITDQQFKLSIKSNVSRANLAIGFLLLASLVNVCVAELPGWIRNPTRLANAITAGRSGLTAMLPVTTFWSFVREFPREVLNWGPVRTVSQV